MIIQVFLLLGLILLLAALLDGAWRVRCGKDKVEERPIRLLWHGIHKKTKKAETAAVGTKSDLFLPLLGMSRWTSKWRFFLYFCTG